MYSGMPGDWSFSVATWNIERPARGSWKRLPAILQKFSVVEADIWSLWGV